MRSYKPPKSQHIGLIFIQNSRYLNMRICHIRQFDSHVTLDWQCLLSPRRLSNEYNLQLNVYMHSEIKIISES